MSEWININEQLPCVAKSPKTKNDYIMIKYKCKNKFKEAVCWYSGNVFNIKGTMSFVRLKDVVSWRVLDNE